MLNRCGVTMGRLAPRGQTMLACRVMPVSHLVLGCPLGVDPAVAVWSGAVGRRSTEDHTGNRADSGAYDQHVN